MYEHIRYASFEILLNADEHVWALEYVYFCYGELHQQQRLIGAVRHRQLGDDALEEIADEPVLVPAQVA